MKMKKIFFILILSMFILTGCKQNVCIKSHTETQPAFRFDCGPSMGFDGHFEMACGYRNFFNEKEIQVCDEWETKDL